jgi:multiple sugar transport system substrate-binding protein
MKSPIVVAAAIAPTLGLAACGGGGGVSASSAVDAQGPISIWYSNNAQQVAWGEQMVASWNKLHLSEKVSGQQISAAASSEEVIGAAIAAGSEPCPVYNTAPAAVPTFEQQGGLVPLNDFPGAVSYIQARTGPGGSKTPSGRGVRCT